MQTSGFIGRAAELTICRKMAKANRFECLVLYGRRRVGKTFLILEILKEHRGLYFAFEQQGGNVLLEKFSEQLLQLFPSPYLARFESFEQSFLYLTEQVRSEPFILALDEFQYIAMQDSGFLSMLQNMIDHHWLKIPLFLILCGSYMSFMESEVLGYKSPVYGRRTGSIKLEPMRFSEARYMLAGYNNTDAFIAWGIVGGMPLYLKQFDTTQDIRTNIQENILAKGSLLNNEPLFALKQELREPGTYLSILEGISSGRSKYNEISTWIGTDAGYYLNNLIALGIVRREMPFGDKDNARKGIYRLSDPFFHFYFRYISRNYSLVEAERHDLLMNEMILPSLDEFLADRFESLCKESLHEMNGSDEIPFIFTSLGRWWGTDTITRKQEEIDIVASDGKDHVLLGECKWRITPVPEQDLTKLMTRRRLLPQKNAFLLVFSRKGLSEKASILAQSQGILQKTFQEKGNLLWKTKGDPS